MYSEWKDLRGGWTAQAFCFPPLPIFQASENFEKKFKKVLTKPQSWCIIKKSPR